MTENEFFVTTSPVMNSILLKTIFVDMKATRLRANRNYIIPDKKRGEGIELGGNLKQKWIWTETINSQ